jgi:hypothetical protein
MDSLQYDFLHFLAFLNLLLCERQLLLEESPLLLPELLLLKANCCIRVLHFIQLLLEEVLHNFNFFLLLLFFDLELLVLLSYLILKQSHFLH